MGNEQFVPAQKICTANLTFAKTSNSYLCRRNGCLHGFHVGIKREFGAKPKLFPQL